MSQTFTFETLGNSTVYVVHNGARVLRCDRGAVRCGVTTIDYIPLAGYALNFGRKYALKRTGSNIILPASMFADIKDKLGIVDRDWKEEAHAMGDFSDELIRRDGGR